MTVLAFNHPGRQRPVARIAGQIGSAEIVIMDFNTCPNPGSRCRQSAFLKSCQWQTRVPSEDLTGTAFPLTWNRITGQPIAKFSLCLQSQGSTKPGFAAKANLESWLVPVMTRAQRRGQSAINMGQCAIHAFSVAPVMPAPHPMRADTAIAAYFLDLPVERLSALSWKKTFDHLVFK